MLRAEEGRDRPLSGGRCCPQTHNPSALGSSPTHPTLQPLRRIVLTRGFLLSPRLRKRPGRRRRSFAGPLLARTPRDLESPRRGGAHSSRQPPLAPVQVDPGPAPAQPGYGRCGPRSWRAVASSTGRPRPRRRSSRRTPPRCSYPRPDLLLPQLDRYLVPLDRPSCGLLPRPAVPLQQPISVFTRASVHRWSAQPWASGPRSNSRSSLAICVGPSLGRPGDPFVRTPASPRSRQARRHRSTDRSLTRNAAAMSRFFSPCAKRSTASSRIRSRASLPASVSPPPCAYLTPHSYRRPPTTVRRTAPTSPDQVQ